MGGHRARRGRERDRARGAARRGQQRAVRCARRSRTPTRRSSRSRSPTSTTGHGHHAHRGHAGERRTPCIVGHVGDSRAYLLRDGELRADHHRPQPRRRSSSTTGRLTADEAAVHPMRNDHHALARDRRAASTSTCTRSSSHAAIASLFCSDGLTDMVHDDAIARRAAPRATTRRARRTQLVDAANRAGGVDNITVVIVARHRRRPGPERRRTRRRCRRRRPWSTSRPADAGEPGEGSSLPR